MTTNVMGRWLLLISASTAIAAGCGITENMPAPPAMVTFRLQNDGTQPVYLSQNCLIDYTITSLTAPVHGITRVDGCACSCGLTGCSVCGACAHGALAVPVGMSQNDLWRAVDVTQESTPTGSCVREQKLSIGPYRIDVPVYASEADATALTGARTATQSFTLPESGIFSVDVALGVSP